MPGLSHDASRRISILKALEEGEYNMLPPLHGFEFLVARIKKTSLKDSCQNVQGLQIEFHEHFRNDMVAGTSFVFLEAKNQFAEKLSSYGAHLV